jgi:molybdopterin-guanine dinucleotide biosynthesis protein A
MKLSGIILAGGQSRRMGTDKAFLPVGGRLLIERVLDVVASLSDDIVIVTNSPERYAAFGARLVADVFPGTGALGGIYTGLQASRHAYGLVVACDMPFLNRELLRYMAGLADEFDAVVPALGTASPDPSSVHTARKWDLHPLHAIYAKTCLAPIERALQRGDLRTIAFLSEVRVRYIGSTEVERFDPQRRSFFNANTPEELERARKMAEE